MTHNLGILKKTLSQFEYINDSAEPLATLSKRSKNY